jgi:hypothetical protein
VIAAPQWRFGDGIARGDATMRLTIRAKFTYGFLMLAFGMMLTDVCKLMLAPSPAALSATGGRQHERKF